MLKRTFLAGLAALALALPLAAQTQPPAGAPVLEIDVAGQASGTIRIALRPDLAPQHVERIITLAERGDYNGVVFHRVIEGFMAQTGDVANGRPGGNPRAWGTGGSDLPNLPAEFSAEPFVRGVMGMARSQNPNSANSQFFLMFAPASHLNGGYTVLGQIIDGFDVLDAIKLGTGGNGAIVGEPDVMAEVRVVR
jgi:cyclophilin family peptidyl-prolyl cis-trans isomerase